LIVTASANAPTDSVAVPKAMARLFIHGSSRTSQGEVLLAATGAVDGWRLLSWVEVCARSVGERTPAPRVVE